MKQCKRFHLPKINNQITFEAYLKLYPKGFIGHCYSGEKIKAKEIKTIAPFLIGPEGDFTKDEVKAALDSGYTEIELSRQRLLTETAALTSVFYLAGV